MISLKMLRLKWLARLSLLLGTLVTIPVQGSQPADTSEGRSDRFAQLEASLSGATLVGHFTVTGRESIEPKPERYELQSVEHLEGDQWTFRARIKYGEHDVTLPLTLPVKWAGNTPVVTVDDVAFPGLGTYSARVMIYQDHYSGFWSGGDHGGHLFGVVEREEKDSASPEDGG